VLRRKAAISSPEAGFSLPEVMVSSLLLAMISANAAQLYLQSGQTIRRSSLQDSVQARVADDLEALGRESARWACEPGTSCSGKTEDADEPVNYQTGRTCSGPSCPSETPPIITSYKSSCDNNSLAQLMQQEHKRGNGDLAFPANTMLSWDPGLSNLHTLPNIQRTITVDENDQNQLVVSYTTTGEGRIKESFQAVLTPDALAWCP